MFTEGDRSRDVAVVSHAFWKGKLGGAAAGTATLTLNEQAFTVVGVLPVGFQGPGGLYAPDVWVPLERRGALALPADVERSGHNWLTLVGRRRRGVSAAQAATDLTSILRGVDGAPAERDGGIRARFAPMADGHPEARALMFVAAVGMAAVTGVLLIACFNVAGLLLTRASERQREMAVRSALGASPGRLVRQLVIEAFVLAALAGGLAASLSLGSGRLLAAFSLPALIPQQLNLSADARSVAFTLLLIVVAALLPPVLPARQATRHDLRQVLAGEAGTTASTPRRGRARRVFQACQIAGSTMFLALTVLFVGSFRHMLAANPGFDTRGVLLVTADPQTLGRQPHQAEAFFRGLTERLRRDPRVRRAAAATGVPYSIGRRATTLGRSGQDCRTEKCLGVQMFVVDPGYLRAMRIPLRGGRDLGDEDRTAGGGILVSQSTAQQLWPQQNPIGQVVTAGPDGELAQVVGVTADVAVSGLGSRPTPQAYRAMRTADYAGDGIMLVVGARGDPAHLADTIRRAAADLDPFLPIRSVLTMSEHLWLPLWAPRVAARFFGICGTLALLLATVGLFGVVSYAVAQRTREFGIRIALGAGPRSILQLVLSEGFVLTATGALMGLLAARGLAALMGSALVGVRAGDSWPYLLAAALQAAVALLACGYPARRAMRADVLGVMRGEH